MTMRIVSGMPVDVHRKKVRRITLRVTSDRGIILSVPTGFPDAEIDRYVTSKKEWIEGSLKKVGCNADPVEKGLCDGGTMPVLGKMYAIRIVAGRKFRLELQGDEAVVMFPEDADEERRKRYVREWYRKVLTDALHEVVPKWELMTGLECSEWSTRVMRTKWGACRHGVNKIWFNVRLAEKPLECIEYVVLHELAHIRIPNHGPMFRAYMDGQMPDWKLRKDMLNRGLISDRR